MNIKKKYVIRTMMMLWSEVKRPGGTVCNTKGNICYEKSVMTHGCLRLSFKTEVSIIMLEKKTFYGLSFWSATCRLEIAFSLVLYCMKQADIWQFWLWRSWRRWQFLTVIKSRHVVTRQIFTKLEWPYERRAVNEMGCNWISIAEMNVSWFAYSVVYC